MSKVLVAMSGGVDSSVAAKLLLDEGHTVTGATIKLYSNEDVGMECRSRTCCALSDIEDARRVALCLGIDYHVFNFTDQFAQQVMDQFAQSYLQGETPNPCIECNKHMKFDLFLKRARLLGYDQMATGHYASSEYDAGSGRWLLKRPGDDRKDQTYVLYGMTQEQLAGTLFPVNRLTKAEIRRIAAESGFSSANKPDSQDICFVKNGDYAAFIEEYTGISMLPGDFVDARGGVLGRHGGIGRYTIGQRKGLGLSFGKPHYVTAKNPEDNTVTLGPEEELFSKRLVVRDLNLIAVEHLTQNLRVTAQTRYHQTEVPATLIPLDETHALVEFDAPQRAVAPGQAAVFYDGPVVVGGGTISAV